VRARGRPARVRVLVFNYFAGLKPRGIPVYARELEECFQRVGAQHRELRAPAWMGAMPSWVQNVGFVLYEQLVAPLLARVWRCEFTVYPYNSSSLWDAACARSVMVVHDLIPNRRRNRGMAARYIRWCQAWHQRMRRPVATVSRHTLRQLNRVAGFQACEKYLWANPFYAFERALENAVLPVIRVRSSDGPTLLLCSGVGPNKDFRGALRLLDTLSESAGWQIRVLGFGADAPLAVRAVRQVLPAHWHERIHVLPRLSLQETVSEYLHCDVAWVHSRTEGFGRPVMEARLCGRSVVASDIGAFRQLRRFRHVHLYREAEFPSALRAAMEEARFHVPSRASAAGFNRQLEEEVLRFLVDQGGRRR